MQYGLYLYLPVELMISMEYIFRYDYYGDSGIEYELHHTSNKHNYHALVPNYVKKGDSIFFTYINGTFDEGFCYYERKIYLGKIDLKTNKLENNININLYFYKYSY